MGLDALGCHKNDTNLKEVDLCRGDRGFKKKLVNNVGDRCNKA